MRTIQRYSGYFALGFCVMFGMVEAQRVEAATSPSSLVAKVMEVVMSTKNDCTSAISVFKAASPTATDFIANPTLGTGPIPDGTYHCVGIHVSDLVTVTPKADDGASCKAGTAFTQDIYTTAMNGDVSYTPGGTLINATGSPTSPSEDDPWLYFSDVSQAAATNTCFLPPFAQCACVNAGPCPLTAFTVSGDQTHTLTINFANKVGDFGNGRCEIHFPTISLN